MKAVRKKSRTYPTPQQRLLLAAVLGGSNLGMRLPSPAKVEKAASMDKLVSMVNELWHEYFETQQIMDMFHDECRWWLEKEQIGDDVSIEYVHRVWPHIGALVFGKS
jgi:hypothetical protein